MFNQIRAVTDVIGDHLVRASGSIASHPCTGTAEGLVDDLTKREVEILGLIGSGSVRRNQLDEVRNSLQAVRLLKKFRYGGNPETRREAALAGFLERNDECLRAREPSFLREQLLGRMARVLKRALPAPVDDRFTCSSYLRRPDWLQRIGLAQYVSMLPSELREWSPVAEMPWGPRFGTGAVSEGIPFLHRWEMTDGSDPILEAIRSGDVRRMWREIPASGSSRAQAVPKERLKDRLITIEPFQTAFLQHCVRRAVYESIHQGPLRWTAMDVVYLEDAQKIQRRYALSGSRDSTVATVDLKDASDRIWREDVWRVMPCWLVPLLEMSRSTHCEVGPKTVELGMYAGMGNATTFVVETLMFWAATVAIMSLNGKDVDVCSVYGDDVVCDTRCIEYIREGFAALGWVINDRKSYWGPCPLRESCGIWAFNGQEITTARFDGYDLSTPEGLAGFRESIANLLNSGSGTSILVADRLMKTAGPFIPVSSLDIPGSHVVHDKYGMWMNNYSRITTRINKDTQLIEAKVDMTSPKMVEVPADRIGYLYGSLAGQIRTDAVRNGHRQIKAHVVRVPVPYRNVTKPRWVAATPRWGMRSPLPQVVVSR